MNNVAEYMASGLPWCTSSLGSPTPFRIDFPYVASSITIYSEGTGTKLGFTENGIQGTNFVSIPANQPVTLNYRVITVFVIGSGPFTVAAGLTQISAMDFPILTSSLTPVSGEFGYPGLG